MRRKYLQEVYHHAIFIKVMCIKATNETSTHQQNKECGRALLSLDTACQCTIDNHLFHYFTVMDKIFCSTP